MPKIDTVYMPCGPDPNDSDERTRWYKYASTFNPDEEVNFAHRHSGRLTNALYMTFAELVWRDKRRLRVV